MNAESQPNPPLPKVVEKASLITPSLYGGRFTRAQFWGYIIVGGIISSIGNTVAMFATPWDTYIVFALIWSILWQFLYNIPVFVKRCHDIGFGAIMPIVISVILSIPSYILILSSDSVIDYNRNGQEMMPITMILGIIGLIWFLFLGCKDSERGTNEYGTSTKYPN